MATRTVYVRNLAERPGGERLKASVAECFGQIGPVVDVYVRKAMRHRGQAFVVFQDPVDAQKAIEQLNGQPLDGREMSVAMARAPADAELEATDSKLLPIEKQRRIEVRTARAARAVLSGLADTTAATMGADLNNVLFFEGLSATETQELAQIYNALPGYVESRAVPARGVAFVEFENTEHAITALASPPPLLPPQARVSFAKK